MIHVKTKDDKNYHNVPVMLRVRVMVFNATFSFIGGGNRRNHRPVASH
jgi:hypothetical protein